MLWLSSDSNTSCSRRRHHRPRSSSSSSLSSSTGDVSYFLEGPASWRTTPPPPRQQTTVFSAIGALPTSTLLVRAILVWAFVVMIIRCEQPLLSSAGGRPNGSDWKSLIRHSFLNQTGLRGGRWHPPARPSPALARSSSGRTRHRHQPYLPWFNSSHTSPNSLHGSHHEDRPFGLVAAGDETTSGLKYSLADIVLPRQMVSKPGARYSLPHNATTLSSQSEKDGVPRDATGTTSSPNSLHLVGGRVVAGVNFTLTSRLLRNNFVGNLVSDKNHTETLRRQRECLILDSYVIRRVCSQLNSSVYDLSFEFCSHLHVADAMNPSDRRCQLKQGATTLDDCHECLFDLYKKDCEAQSMYARFDDALFKYDCEDPYSTEWNCTDCKLAYRHWVCSVTIPHYRNEKLADPCSHYSEMVENRCPYLSPHSQFQYAGEPVFLSTESDASYTEMKPLRSCHFLCEDRSINPQTSDPSYMRYIQLPDYCSNTVNLCYLPAEDNDEQLMELMNQTNESNFVSTFPLAVSMDRGQSTGLPDNTLQPANHSRTYLESEEGKTDCIPSLTSNSCPLELKLTSMGILLLSLVLCMMPLLVSHVVLL